jgi:hypothetical protein
VFAIAADGTATLASGSTSLFGSEAVGVASGMRCAPADAGYLALPLGIHGSEASGSQ